LKKLDQIILKNISLKESLKGLILKVG